MSHIKLFPLIAFGLPQSGGGTADLTGITRQQSQFRFIVMTIGKHAYLWPLLLTWFNFNPSMDK